VSAATPATSLRLRRLDLGGSDPSVAAEARVLCRRSAVPDMRVREIARGIVEEVRDGGASAVRAINARVGGGRPDGRLLLDGAELTRALDVLPVDLRRALETSIENVLRFARTQRPETSRTTIVPGVEIERRWTAIESVGCYVPGGSAPLPSSLVMTVVPARVAGVVRIVVASPAGPDGTVDPVVLATAALLNVDAFLVAGGAQAIAALAFGLADEGVAPVDRIVGPGSAWVTAAKLELAGEVGIDFPAGPSEGLVLADGAAEADIVAADLLTQAEHGPDSPAILVTTDAAFADAVESALNRRLAGEPRAAILDRSLAEHGRIVLAPDLDSAIDFVNAYGPEHLSVELSEPQLELAVARIRNAGSMFVGRWAPESAGDYATGANHVLPTGGLARASGALSVEQFGKFIQVQRLTQEGLATLAPTIAAIADAEGLHAHRAAVDVRFETEGRGDRP
jgi:histidinol dehydrogenase